MKEYCLYESKDKIEKHGDNAYVTFLTTAQKFTLSYSVSDIVDGNFPHVGITTRKGLAILLRKMDDEDTPSSEWMPVDLVANKNEEEVNLSHIVSKNSKYEIAIYGPILAHLEKLSVKIPNDVDFFWKKSEKHKAKILMLGNQHTFGIGVTSTAMMFSNIFRRNYDVDLKRESTYTYKDTNIEADYKKITNVDDIASYDLVIYEIGKLDAMKDNFESDFKVVLSKLCKASKVILWHSWDPNYKKRNGKIDRIINECASVNGNWQILNFDCLFEPMYRDLYTYSTKFLNDAANIFIYKGFEESLRDNGYAIFD